MVKPFLLTKFHRGDRPLAELLIILLTAIGVYLITGQYDLFEELVALAEKYEAWEIDEILIITFYLSITLTLFAFRRWRQQTLVEHTLQLRLAELKQAMSEVRQLRGIMPICASCKKIRDDQGFWHQVEVYIREHSEADFTHGICPNCLKVLYPNYRRKQQ